MTVASNTPYDQYSATAAQTVFNYTFEIVEQTDIFVYQRGENDSPNDTNDLLVLNVDYTVAGAGNENGGTITLTSGATLDDVITLKQNVPVERDTSFTNGGVLRAEDLNNEYDAQMLTQQVTRFNEENRMLSYWDSAVLTDPKDLIIPVLSANQIFAMNNAGDEIIPYNVPAGGGLAPDDATYLLKTANANLPNAQVMALLATGIVINTATTGVQLTRLLAGVANQTVITNPTGLGGNPTVGIENNVVLPGTAGMGIPSGTTAQRVTPTAPSIGLRFNTTLENVEYYDHTLTDWVQLETSNDIANLIARLAAHTVGDGASMIGLEDQGTVSSKTVQDLAQASFVTVNNDTATLLNSQQLSALALLLSGGTMVGTINMDSNTIINLPLPSIASEPATKGYVDGIAFNTHPAANYSTTANLAGYTYDNGATGVGATLTAGSNGAFSVDGQSPVLNDRILVPFQTNQAHNGIYTLTQVGDGSSPAILTRATDYDTADDMQAGDEIAVIAGDTLAGSKWMMTQTAAIVVGTTDITWLNITDSQNVVTLTGAQTITGAKTFDDLTLGGDMDADSNKIINLLDPTNPQDAASKAYVDSNVGVALLAVQSFSASGTYTPTTGMKYCIVRAVAGGGGGGGADANPGSTASAGNGGGSGSFSEGLFSAATIGASQTVTIGAGGTAGSAGTGGTGGVTSLGALMTTNGGTGGGQGPARGAYLPTPTVGNGGAAGSGGYNNFRGAPGGIAHAGNSGSSNNSGFGASSFYGGGGSPIVNATSPGSSTVANGAGGGGGASLTTGAAQTGGVGGGGYIEIIEFI